MPVADPPSIQKIQSEQQTIEMSARGARWKNLRRLVLVSPVLACLAFVLVLRLGESSTRGQLVYIRDIVASSELRDLDRLYVSPTSLETQGFEFDGEAEAKWLVKNAMQTESTSEVLAAASVQGGTLEKAKRLTQIFSVSAFDQKVLQLRLIPKIHVVHQGHGLCSDHTQVMMALATVANLTVRELQSENHGFCEVYAPETQQWIHFDPEWAAYAVDEKSNPISSRELRERKLTGRPWNLVFFGTAPTSPNSLNDSRVQIYYRDRKRFERLAYGKGNRVISVARDNMSNPLPWELRKLWIALTDSSSRLFEVADRHNETLATNRVRWRASIVILSGICILVYVTVLLAPWIRRLQSAYKSRLSSLTR